MRKAAEDTHRTEMEKFKTAREAWDEKNRAFIEEIDGEFKNDINKARADFKSAFTGAKSTEAKLAARNALGAATLAATTARQVALESLGEPPTPPAKPIIPPRPLEPLKPLDPALAKNGKRQSQPGQPLPNQIPNPPLEPRGKNKQPEKVNPKKQEQPKLVPGNSKAENNPSA